MSGGPAIDDVVKRLSSPETDVRSRLEAAITLRDSLDHYTTGQVYTPFLRRLVPSFENILKGPCVFQSSSPEQKLRHCILEIFHRLPTGQTPTEPFEPFAERIVDLLMNLVRNDNEENATLCVKITSDIMRHQQKVLAGKVQPFLNLIQELFEGMKEVVRDQLDSNPVHGPSVGSSTPGCTQTTFQAPRPGSPVASVTDLGPDPQQQSRALHKGIQSFKVLSECPIIVVSIFQVYRNTVQNNVKAFVPLIKGVLCLQAKAQAQAHADAKARGTTFSGVSPNIKNRAAFGDFITAQVKTMSFLAYLLRQYSSHLSDFLPTLPDIVVRLLQDCPREKSGARKELLVAIRHIINFNFRIIFLGKIDELLEERTLIGDGLTVHDTMRPLAYSMLADLIHHVRDSLEPQQIRKTVEVYTRNVQDNFLGPSFQTMSAKLLLNMAECIAKMQNKADARHYLIMILNAIGDKFASMNRQYPNAVKVWKAAQAAKAEKTANPVEEVADNYLADRDNPPEWDEIDIFRAMPICSANPREKGADPVADNKFLFRNLMTGLKNTFYQLKTCNPPSWDPKTAPPGWQDVSYGFTAEEVQVIIKLFREGAHVFCYYGLEKVMPKVQYNSPVEYMANLHMVSSTKEEKDLLETFGTVFHCIDPATFHEVFQLELPRLYEMTFEHSALLYIPQFFLASETTSPSFCGMLLRFLMERIHEVGSGDVKKSSILLRLFKLAFMAVDLFATQNEQILMPHIVDLVTKAIELSTTAEEPINYFLLLRSLFRSIGGGKFDQLYKLILPLLEMLLDVLNNLLLSARRPTERDLYVELCLTVPARLSNLLPHLSYLMRPLVIALQAETELVGQGLRTLELCVDNLTADYLDPIMAPVIDDLMTALFSHLRPHPYNHYHAHTTMKILGKLGGRNRRFISTAPELTFRQYADDPSSVDVRLIGSKHDRAFPVQIGIDLAIRKLMEVPKPSKSNQTKKTDAFYKKQAFDLVKTQVKVRIGTDSFPEDLPRLVRLHAQELVNQKSDADLSYFESSDRERSIVKKSEEADIMKRLLKAVMFVHSIPEFKEDAAKFLVNVCSHFTLIEVGRALIDWKRARDPFDQNASEGPLFIDTRVLATAILESMASDLPDMRDAAHQAIRNIHDSASAIVGNHAYVGRLSFFTHLANIFVHGCYEEEWFTKAGGVLGVKALISDLDLGDQWVKSRQIEFVRALLHVVKDIPQDLPEKTRSLSQDVLELLVSRITHNIKKEDAVYTPVPPPQTQGQAQAPPQLRGSRLAQVCIVLNSELSHMNKHVRITARKSLESIAKAAGAEVWELTMPHKNRLLEPIFSKPLRALPFPTQIGYIDAVTYCLGLKADYIPFEENLNRLLMESLALADASDDSLASKPGEFRTHNQIVELRVSCIKLLSTAMSFEDFMKSPVNQTHQTRAKIITVFFNRLYSESNVTIEAANDALKAILKQTQKLPKDLLQQGLRPVLANLHEPKRLTIHGIENLARLLKLLTNYFKVEIGARLLDHVKVLADPSVLQPLSFKYFEQEQSMKLITAVFDIFHLLSDAKNAAAQFKERLIDTVLDLEEKLRRTHLSPFRDPLYLFLNRYPSETWTFLTQRLENIKYGRFLAQVLNHPQSQPLRDFATSKIGSDGVAATEEGQGQLSNVDDNRPSPIEALIKRCADMVDQSRPSRFAALISVINATNALCRSGSVLASTSRLEHIGKDLESNLRRNTLPPSLRLAAHQAGEQLMEILVRSVERNPKDLDGLFSLIESVTSEELRASQVLFSYMYRGIICNESVDFWKSIVLRCLDVYAGKTASEKTKWWILHYMVNPIVAMDVQRHWLNSDIPEAQQFLDSTVIDSINTNIWKVNLPDPQDDLVRPRVDHTRMEVLQLSAMLVKYHHNILQDARKDIIKFGWTYIRLDDVINKNAAYVVIGYFIAHYDTPAKIVSQVYVSLLKTSQNEGRPLVAQGLELIAPVLPKRCQGPNDRNAVWAVAPRRILAEEGQNAQQLTSIFHFLVRHPNLFFEARDKFVMFIITSLRKIANLPNPSNETKKLALKMMSLIWQWEKRRVEESSPPEATQGEPTAPTTYIIPALGRQKMIRYLVEFIAQLNERYPLPSARPPDPNPPPNAPKPVAPELCQRAIELLYNLLQPEYWGDLETVDLFPNVTDLILCSQKAGDALSQDPADKEKYDEKMITSIVNTLQVVRIVLHTKPDDWVLKHMPQIQKILDKCLRSENPEIQDCLHYSGKEYDGPRELKSIVCRILDALPEDVPMEDADAEGEPEAPNAELATFLSNIAGEAMNSSNYISGVNLLWSLGEGRPGLLKIIDQHIQPLLKALQSKLARDHVGHYTTVANSLAQAAASNRQVDTSAISGDLTPYELSIQTGLLIKAIRTLSLRMESLGDQRRPFLSVIASLVEKSLHNQLCEKILDMVEGWVLRPEGTWPTLKEKTAVLLKMLAFENRQDSTMLRKFLDLVISIYEDPKVARTELTVRMEHAFLIGTRAQDVDIRNRFLTIFDKSMTRTATARITYVVCAQNWDSLADSFWLAQATRVLLGGVEMNSSARLHREDFVVPQVSRLFGIHAKSTKQPALEPDEKLDAFMTNYRQFLSELADVKIRDVLEPLGQLQHADSKLAHELWVVLFPMFWSVTAKDERAELERALVKLLVKESHSRQLDKRPNVVQSLIAGAVKAWPQCKLPYHVLKFQARQYDAWYTALVQLEKSVIQPEIDTPTLRESSMDALLELYAGLQEEDMFYGTWRRRCQFVETNAALSYEQNGMWDKAQRMYEAAQVKARSGSLPFSHAEYMLWEDQWAHCAQKLQQWDILRDFSKHENLQDLLLECVWRNMEGVWTNKENRDAVDQVIKGVMDAPTPRRAFFQAFMSLLKYHDAPSKQEAAPEFVRLTDEAVQLSIRKWHQLPRRLTQAHIPILQNFQQLIELHDAMAICNSLASTNQSNLDVKSGELKLLLGSWRDRLPNVWDDITLWQDLVTWRQHVFGLINTVYLNVVQAPGQSTNGASFAYRGYHETAWIINRFAHVARKHSLSEVCINQLSRIYALPNIEIQEAFLKLREQAKCHYESADELSNGLDVINNTNLAYFSDRQKAQFYTLKGMFLDKMGQREEADAAFGTALHFDLSAAKAWAQWAHYHDRRFKDSPQDLNAAKQAVTCYLQAAGSYKNAKSRKLIARIIWLLSLDDASGTIGSGIDDYKGEIPVWYWITFIPQLLTGLGHKEAPRLHTILLRIAKTYPQALYFQLRTTREDMNAVKKAQENKEKQRQRAMSANASNSSNSKANGSPTQTKQEPGSRPQTSSGDSQPKTEGAAGSSEQLQLQAKPTKRAPWEYAEEIMSNLKSAFPLLALSMETMVDQIQGKFKCPADEDAYRLIVALLNDGLQYVNRTPTLYSKEVKLPTSTETNITRFAETILPPHIRPSFEAEFVKVKPTMYEYIHKLRRWRDKFEEKLDRRTPQHVSLEGFSPHLSEFKYLKFDEVEIPGQYLQLKDKNTDFIRIDRFLPSVDLVRSSGSSHRRLKIRGHDGSVHSFAVQHPAARHCRREERILQLFRQLNQTLSRKKESRRRDLQFTLPLMIPLAPHIRIVQEDTTYISLQGVYEDHCRRQEMSKDQPMIFTLEKLRSLIETKAVKHGEQSLAARMEVFTAIQDKWVPKTMALEYFQAIYPEFADFWLFKRRFSYQFAALTFMTYVLYMHQRYPHKIHIARGSGNVWGSDLMSAMSTQKPFFHNSETVPFRLTPNLQVLMGPLATEGIFSCSMMAIARCLTEPEHELEFMLTLFVRDELMFWSSSGHRAAATLNESQFRESVQLNCDMIVKRAISLAQTPDGGLPANQTVIDTISRAVNPLYLAQADVIWMPYV